METTTTDVQYGVNVMLSEQEAKLFIEFRKYQNIWQAIFDETPKSKKIELHFDKFGILEFAESNKRYYNIIAVK